MRSVRSETSTSRRPLRLVAFIAAAAASLPAPARAEESSTQTGDNTPISKAQCAESFEQVQRLRNSFHYLDASAEALRCASQSCGAVLSEACGSLYSELQAATPSVVLAARSDDGNELGDVEVSIDDSPKHIALDGTPVLLDPGSHDFVFTASGFTPLKKTAVILAGERFRPILGVLTKEQVQTGPPAEKGGSPRDERRRIPVVSYVFGGAAIAGFAGFIGFRVAGVNEYDSLARDCKPNCSQSSVDSARQKYELSYVGLAIGTAASIAAVTVYLASPRAPSQQTAALQLRTIPNGATADFSARF